MSWGCAGEGLEGALESGEMRTSIPVSGASLRKPRITRPEGTGWG